MEPRTSKPYLLKTAASKHYKRAVRCGHILAHARLRHVTFCVGVIPAQPITTIQILQPQNIADKSAAAN